MNRLILSIACLASLSLFGCKDFVQNIQAPISSVDDKLLSSESQTNFVVTGVIATFNNTTAQLTCLSDGLSDALVFDTRLSTATYPTYLEVDMGNIRINNGSVEDAELALGQLRLYADTLVSRAKGITYKDTSLRNLAMFTGYFYGGVARYYYATYFALNPTEGGGVINLSPFIPSSQMYALALERLNLALQYATPDQAAQTHTLIARIHLLTGDYTTAATDAGMGMQSGASDLLCKFSSEASNFWWSTAGNGRLQFTLDPRFHQYVQDDPKEAARLPMVPVPIDSTLTLYQQDKYPEDASSISFLTWQENELILAECAARANDLNGALGHVNSVRTSHGLDQLTSISLDSIYIERDKELFCTGARLADERRFNKWHLGADTWQYLPITQRERTANPNLH
ncbi:MAG: hypothetical protein JSS75_06640 [Bacteroidetes bacterium]|nr:hypothetical protein [Bacteroidota bacterium]